MTQTMQVVTEGEAQAQRFSRLEVEDSPYSPKTFAEVMEIAEVYSKSRLTKCRSKDQIALIMATGRDLGISETTALRMIYVADFGQGDQATLSADLMKALCLRSPRCEYFRLIESTDAIATYEAKRAGDPPVRMSFSQADRERAKLGMVKEGKDSTSSNWAKYPSAMLRHRAASLLAREVFPDLIGGFYTDDEMQEVAAATPGDPGKRFAGLEVDVQPLRPASASVVGSTATSPASYAAPVVEETIEARAARWEAQLRAATDEAAGKGVVAEIVKALPDKTDGTRKRLASLFAERKAAGWAVAAPAVVEEPACDPVTGEVLEREPGSDDDE